MVKIQINPFTYDRTSRPLESKPKLETEDPSSPTPSIETFTLTNDSESIDIYTIIKKRSNINESTKTTTESYKHWKDWDCKTHQFTDCANLYDNIDEEFKRIIFFIGFRTMIYGDHLHDFGSSKVYTSNRESQERIAWSEILFKGCLEDIRWFIREQTKSSKSTAKSPNIEKIIINILKYLLLNQFMFWYTKTINLSQINNLSKDLKNSIKQKYLQQQANICSITRLDDYIKIFKYIDFCGYFCGKVILYRSNRGRRGEDTKEKKDDHPEIRTLHDEMGKFICNWTLKSIFCIYPKSLKNMLGCDQEQLSKNFIEQNVTIFEKIYQKSRPKDDKKNTIIQLRIDQEGDTRNHLAIFNSITENTRQYVTCENINASTNDDNNEDFTNDYDSAALYIKKMLTNSANRNLGIIYDYAGWQDPGCTTLPRLRSDLATLYELQILVPRLEIQQIYYFATIPIIRYIYHGPARGCSYNQFFKHNFLVPTPLSSSETSVNNITIRAKNLVGSQANNVITSNLTIKTFGDLNQCIIFGYYYGNIGFYLNQDNHCLPIFMTGDVISGYMSALISNQVITEKHDKSNTMRQHTRELIDGVIYYLNCSEKNKHNEYLKVLKETLTETMALNVATAVAEDETYLEELPDVLDYISDVFDYICPDEPTYAETNAAIDELNRFNGSMDVDKEDLNEDETLDLINPSNSPAENLYPNKRPRAGRDRQKGKQTYKNKVKRANKAKRTKRAKRANKVKRAYRTKRTNKVIKTNTTQ